MKKEVINRQPPFSKYNLSHSFLNYLTIKFLMIFKISEVHKVLSLTHKLI